MVEEIEDEENADGADELLNMNPIEEAELPLDNMNALLKEMKTKMDRWNIPHGEALIYAVEYKRLSEAYRSQIDLLKKMEKEISESRRLWNARVVFYRQLQQLSDAVTLPKDDANCQKELDRLLELIASTEASISQSACRKRYLDNLVASSLQDNEKQICRICQCDIVFGLFLPCGHLYCEYCITAWLQRHNNCPTCHTEVTLESALRTSFPDKDETLHDYDPALDRDIVVKGNYSSKISAVVRWIVALKQNEPEAKSLIFSQWDKILDIICEALDVNDIRHVRLDSQGKTNALVQFRHDPAIRVFILNARTQSSGMTLVAASHVFLIEPMINPSIEQQAINRVHRIGQTRETHIHRFVVNNSIEEKIGELSQRKRLGVGSEEDDCDLSQDSKKPAREHFNADDYEWLFGCKLFT